MAWLPFFFPSCVRLAFPWGYEWVEEERKEGEEEARFQQVGRMNEEEAEKKEAVFLPFFMSLLWMEAQQHDEKTLRCTTTQQVGGVWSRETFPIWGVST